MTDDDIVLDKVLKEEGAFSRWSRRKREVEQAQTAVKTAKTTETEEKPTLSDADMPRVESLQADSDISLFMSAGVSDALRRKAFRKIFLSERFNVRDGLDDYDEDFTTFQSLGSVVTAEYRRWKARYDEMQSKKKETLPPENDEHDVNNSTSGGDSETDMVSVQQEENGNI